MNEYVDEGRYESKNIRHSRLVEADEEIALGSSVFQKPLVRMYGEHKLLWAIFERAVSDLVDTNINLKEEAEAWFTEPMTEDPGITSFHFIALLFGFDPFLLRNKVFEYVNRKRR